MTSRRAFLTTAGAAVLLGACSGPDSGDDAAEPGLSPSPPAPAGTPTPSGPATLDLAGLERRYDVRLGAALLAPDGRRWAWRASDRFAFCSTIKTYLAAAVLHQVDGGTVTLQDELPVRRADVVGVSPETERRIGRTMTLGQLCAATTGQSDNGAANVLVRHLGGPSVVTTFARTLGDDATRLDRPEPGLSENARGDVRDTTTPDGYLAGYRQLLLGEALTPASRAQLLTWLAATRTSDRRFRAGVPDGWTTADKTGTGGRGATNDAGLLLPPTGDPVLLIVLSDSRARTPQATAGERAVADTVRTAVRLLA